MKKRINKKTLLLIGALSLLVAPLVFKAAEIYASSESVQKSVENISQNTESNDKTVVYYFHTSQRCQSCVMIERMLHQVIGDNFVEYAKKGNLELRAVAVDNPDNRHYIEKYRLMSNSVLVSKMADGEEKEWKNLDGIWRLRTQEQVFNYLKEEVSKYL